MNIQNKKIIKSVDSVIPINTASYFGASDRHLPCINFQTDVDYDSTKKYCFLILHEDVTQFGSEVSIPGSVLSRHKLSRTYNNNVASDMFIDMSGKQLQLTDVLDNNEITSNCKFWIYIFDINDVTTEYPGYYDGHNVLNGANILQKQYMDINFKFDFPNIGNENNGQTGIGPEDKQMLLDNNNNISILQIKQDNISGDINDIVIKNQVQDNAINEIKTDIVEIKNNINQPQQNNGDILQNALNDINKLKQQQSELLEQQNILSAQEYEIQCSEQINIVQSDGTSIALADPSKCDVVHKNNNRLLQQQKQSKTINIPNNILQSVVNNNNIQQEIVGTFNRDEGVINRFNQYDNAITVLNSQQTNIQNNIQDIQNTININQDTVINNYSQVQEQVDNNAMQNNINLGFGAVAGVLCLKGVYDCVKDCKKSYNEGIEKAKQQKINPINEDIIPQQINQEFDIEMQAQQLQHQKLNTNKYDNKSFLSDRLHIIDNKKEIDVNKNKSVDNIRYQF